MKIQQDYDDSAEQQLNREGGQEQEFKTDHSLGGATSGKQTFRLIESSIEPPPKLSQISSTVTLASNAHRFAKQIKNKQVQDQFKKKVHIIQMIKSFLVRDNLKSMVKRHQIYASCLRHIHQQYKLVREEELRSQFRQITNSVFSKNYTVTQENRVISKHQTIDQCILGYRVSNKRRLRHQNSQEPSKVTQDESNTKDQNLEQIPEQEEYKHEQDGISTKRVSEQVQYEMPNNSFFSGLKKKLISNSEEKQMESDKPRSSSDPNVKFNMQHKDSSSIQMQDRYFYIRQEQPYDSTCLSFSFQEIDRHKVVPIQEETDYEKFEFKKVKPMHNFLENTSKSEVDLDGHNLLDHIIHKYFPVQQLTDRISQLQPLNEETRKLCNYANSYKLVKSTKTNKIYAIQNQFDNLEGTFNLTVFEVVENTLSKGAESLDQNFSSLQKVYGPITILQDSRYSSASRNAGTHKAIQNFLSIKQKQVWKDYKYLNPEFISYKVCSDGIEFVIIRNQKDQEIQADQLDVKDQNVLGYLDQDKTFALIKYNFDTGKAELKQQVNVNISELQIGDQDDDNNLENVLLLPVKYLKHLDVADEESNDYFMVQIFELKKNKFIDTQTEMTQRQATVFNFVENNIQVLGQAHLTRCNTMKTQSEIVIPARFINQQKAKFKQAIQDLFQGNEQAYIFVFRDSTLLEIIGVQPSKTRYKVNKKIKTMGHMNDEEVAQSRLNNSFLDQIRNQLGFEKVNIQNTYVEVDDDHKIIDKQFQSNCHEFIKKILENNHLTQDNLSLFSAFLDDLPQGEIHILLANNESQSRFGDGHDQQKEIVMITIDKQIEISNYQIYHNKFVPGILKFNEDIEISQNCLGLQRRFNNTKWRHDDKELEEGQLIGRIVDLEQQERVDKIRKHLNGWALNIAKRNQKILYEDPKEDKQLELVTTDGNGKVTTHNRLISLTMTYKEDDRDTVPVVIYNQLNPFVALSQGYKFCLINSDGKVEPNTVVDLIDKVNGNEVSLCFSSEIIHPYEQVVHDNLHYFAQNFQVQVRESAMLSQVFEIQVKYFDDGTKHAMLVSKKLMIAERYDQLKPLFLKHSEGQEIKCLGTYFKHDMLLNPNLSHDLIKQFDYVNHFTSTKVQKFGHTLVVESYLRKEWILIGHIPQCDILKDHNQQLIHQLFNNSIYQALNSIEFNISLFMNSNVAAQSKDEDLQKWLIEHNRYFMACSVINGRSMAEFCYNPKFLHKALLKHKDKDYEVLYKELQESSQNEEAFFNPLEEMMKYSSHKISEMIAERFLLNKSVVSFNFDYVSNLQILMKKIIGRIKRDDRKYEEHELFQLMFNSLQKCNMLQSFKREHIMTSIDFAVKGNKFREFSKWTTFDGIMEFLQGYQKRNIISTNFSKISNGEYVKNEDPSLFTGPSCLRITNQDFREKRFEHISYQNGNVFSNTELNQQTKDICEGEPQGKNLYLIRPYYIDFFQMNRSTAIDQILKCKTQEELFDVGQRTSHLVNSENLSEFITELFTILRRLTTDPDKYDSVEDLLIHQYTNQARPYYMKKGILFIMFFFIPLFSVMLLNESNNQAVPPLMYSCMITQFFVLVTEIAKKYGQYKRGLLTYKFFVNYQEFIDYFNILLSFIYCPLRIKYNKFIRELNPYNAKEQIDFIMQEEGGSFYVIDIHPMLAATVFFFSVLQLTSYMKLFNEMNNMLALLEKALQDSRPYILFLILWMVNFAVIFKLLGVYFDDGNNYNQHKDEAAYDNHHNDYDHVAHRLTVFIAQMRNSFGDPQPPQYDYWTFRYDYEKYPSKNIAQSYIIITWLVWFFQFFLSIIIVLNFLIAVFSETMDYVFDHQMITGLQNTDDIIDTYMCELDFLDVTTEPIYSIVFATKTTDHEIDQDNDLQGNSKRIQKSIKKMEIMVQKQIQKEGRRGKDQIETLREHQDQQIAQIQGDMSEMKDILNSLVKYIKE